MTLPDPGPDARAHSQRVVAAVRDRIEASGGWISFADYMELVLHAPGLGYYAAGSHKFGSGGDFTTAPELSPVFAQALAAQVAQVLPACDDEIVEVGAGTGALAAELLAELARLGSPPRRYRILELSAELRHRQQGRLASSGNDSGVRVEWLDRLPENVTAVVLGNEVLDSMPVHILHWTDGGILERGVGLRPDGSLRWSERPPPLPLSAEAHRLPVRAPYVSEIALAARAWVAEWGHVLRRGVLLLIDYGLPARELYHPQRTTGTLRGHFRHLVIEDPFFLPGLVDLTTHVDFTAIAETGANAGLDLLGYCGQAQFLINCGLTDILQRHAVEGEVHYLRTVAAVQRLVSPAEMGELFKVIALGRGVDEPLLGFRSGDRRHAL